MQAVVLAAGLGTRMGNLTSNLPKGLLKIAGREILYRNLKTLQNLGVKKVIIVTNPKYKEIYEKFLSTWGINHTIVLNNHPERGNGYSLYLAKDFVTERFVLIMSDHLYEEEFLKKAVNCEGLVVDRLGSFISPEEATRVKIKNQRIEDIGKHLNDYDAFDTGFFVLTPEIFRSAETLVNKKPVVELSEVIKEAKVKVCEVSGYFWMDVDTPEDIKKATKMLIRLSVKSKGDGWISKLINRKISTRISYYLINYFTPNQLTFVTFFLGIFSACLVWWSIPFAGIMYQVSSILDGVDGEIARASMRTSKLGGYIDSVLDRYVDFAFLFSLAWKIKPDFYLWLVILLAVFGSVMVSYSTERYKAAFFEDIYQKISALRYIPGKRDERIFVIMLFCIFNKIRWMFLFLALLTNLRVVLTLALAWTLKEKSN